MSCGRIVMFRSVRERPGQSLIIIFTGPKPNERKGLSDPQLDSPGPPGGLVSRFSMSIRIDILLVLLQRVHLSVSYQGPSSFRLQGWSSCQRPDNIVESAQDSP